jgi:hypothetical protein
VEVELVYMFNRQGTQVQIQFLSTIHQLVVEVVEQVILQGLAGGSGGSEEVNSTWHRRSR